MDEITQEYIEDVKEKALAARVGYASPQKLPTVREAIAKNGPVMTWPAILNLKDRIRWLRMRDNMSQTEFGKKVGAAGNSVSQWESGKNIPIPVRLSKISEFTGCPMSWLCAQKSEEARPVKQPEKKDPKPCEMELSLRGDHTGFEISSMLDGLLDEKTYTVEIWVRG